MLKALDLLTAHTLADHGLCCVEQPGLGREGSCNVTDEYTELKYARMSGLWSN